MLIVKLPPDYKPVTIPARVLERGSGSYWSLLVKRLDNGKTERWVDASAWFSGVTGSHQLVLSQGEH